VLSGGPPPPRHPIGPLNRSGRYLPLVPTTYHSTQSPVHPKLCLSVWSRYRDEVYSHCYCRHTHVDNWLLWYSSCL